MNGRRTGTIKGIYVLRSQTTRRLTLVYVDGASPPVYEGHPSRVGMRSVRVVPLLAGGVDDSSTEQGSLCVSGCTTFTDRGGRGTVREEGPRPSDFTGSRITRDVSPIFYSDGYISSLVSGYHPSVLLGESRSDRPWGPRLWDGRGVDLVGSTSGLRWTRVRNEKDCLIGPSHLFTSPGPGEVRIARSHRPHLWTDKVPGVP